MTRINTNVSSIIAQKTLGRNNVQLQEALTRLSTGLRINVGKDDPAGLIASEVLRSDIVSVKRAITNSERANQVIATADSALGQISTLLNDVRGLVSEAANTGAMSQDQIDANQLQIDSSLEAIDRVAQITSFQGRKLLDGSLDFLTTGINNTQLQDVKIDQANFGTQSSISVSVDVVKQATKGSLNYKFGAVGSDVVLEVGGKNGTEAFSFASGSTIESIASAINLISDATGVEASVETAATKGNVVLSSFGGNNDITLTANKAGFDPGDVRIKYVLGTSSPTSATYTAPTGSDPAKIQVALQTQAYTKASVTIDPAGADNDFKITANLAGADFNGVSVVLNAAASDATTGETVAYNATSKTLTLYTNAGARTAVNFVTEFADATKNQEAAALFSASLVEATGGLGAVGAIGATTLSGGVTGGGIIATANDVVSAINSAAGSVVTATLAEGNNGYGVVSVFQESAYYGVAEQNNRLQFLSPENGPKIQFTSTTNTALSIDTSGAPVTDFAKAIFQNTVANGSLVFTARQKGADYDGWTINLQNNANIDTTAAAPAMDDEFIKINRETKTITIDIDSGVTTANELITRWQENALADSLFNLDNFGTSTGAGVITAPIALSTAGGLVDEGTLVVNLATDANGIITTKANDLITYFNDPANAAALSKYGISVTNAQNSDGTGLLAATTSDITFATEGVTFTNAQATATTYAVNGNAAQLKFSAILSGTQYDGVTVVFQDNVGVTAGTSESAVYDANAKTLTFQIDLGNTKANDILNIFNSAKGNYNATLAGLFSASAVAAGTGLLTTSDTGTFSGGQVQGGTEEGIKLLDNADLANVGLTFTSTTYGSASFVSVKALTGSFGLTDTTGAASERSTGDNINARINGIQAIAKGLQASINTAALDLSFSVDNSVADGSTLTFAITGGGAKFQLGPDVVSNQQARLGIRAVNTAKLGGVSGKLFELRSGNSKSLAGDINGAANVIEEVIKEVTSLRGRLGAFQRTTLQTNIFTLQDTLENLTDAESSIRDADFAAESAALTRAQILVQSGTQVLSIANQNPQNVLSLLR